jgi:hypothetical protein
VNLTTILAFALMVTIVMVVIPVVMAAMIVKEATRQQ